MSTGLCNKLHDTAPTKTVFNLCYIKIYAGAPAASADALAPAPICTVSNNSVPGTGLTWGPTATAGVLAKTVGEVWSGIVAAGGGTAAWFRIVAAGDTGGAVPAEPRLQGTIGVGGGADMVVGSVGLIANATFTINYATLSFVPS